MSRLGAVYGSGYTRTSPFSATSMTVFTMSSGGSTAAMARRASSKPAICACRGTFGSTMQYDGARVHLLAAQHGLEVLPVVRARDARRTRTGSPPRPASASGTRRSGTGSRAGIASDVLAQILGTEDVRRLSAAPGRLPGAAAARVQL